MDRLRQNVALGKVEKLAVMLDRRLGHLEVAAGWMARVRWERSEGVYLSPSEVDVEKVVASWGGINDFSTSTRPTSTVDSMKAVGANPHLQKPR